MSTVIKVENLGKKYIIGHLRKERYVALRDVIAHNFKSFTKNLLRPFGKSNLECSRKEEIWALKDATFEVRQGERIGIIGRNGAGKSTLLKLLSRITEPTTGRIMKKGRVGSLLEVGTGFHPELTGRENIFLNGAILGMSKNDIKNKFDQIVAFAEIEKFLDTPVKRYSSGMYVRLAFAVAAHLETDILLVDEVLAVGDMAFQKKCLGRMGEIAKEGRTLLFISHNLASISNLCERSILLAGGKIIVNDKTNIAIDRYLSYVESSSVSLRDIKDRNGEGRLRFVETWIENRNGERVSCVKSGDYIKIIAQYEIKNYTDVHDLAVGFALSTIIGIPLTDLSNVFSGDQFIGTAPKNGRVECVLPRLPLNSGSYFYNIIARSGDVIEDWILKAGKFDVESSDYFGSGKTMDAAHGMFLFDQNWELVEL